MGENDPNTVTRWQQVYRVTDDLFLRGGLADQQLDVALEALEVYDSLRPPDPRLERHDAAHPDKRRPATVQEMASFDNAQKDRQANELDGLAALQALGSVVLDRFDAAITALNQVRTNPTQLLPAIPAIDRTAFWQDVKQAYKQRLV